MYGSVQVQSPNDSLKWIRETYGEQNLVSAVLHMDEKTPHIHATVIPIVTGERRKAGQEEQNGKKKYRKKNPQDVRLCADDVMARHRLKHYQDTYAQAMNKYGLQRGVDGSLAKHISTMQYYKQLVEQQDSLQENIENLLGLEEEAMKKLKQVKGEINVQKMKGAAVNATTAIADGVSSLFGGSKVKNVTDFGAFIDLGGVDGLLHISEMSWGRTENPKKVYKVGDSVKCFIKEINGNKIALSVKYPDSNPWNDAATKYAVGNVVKGKVARMTDFGAFVQLEEGVDALLHVSQIAKEHIEKPSDVLSIGQEIEAKVVDMNEAEKKISLSMKALASDNAQEESTEE